MNNKEKNHPKEQYAIILGGDYHQFKIGGKVLVVGYREEDPLCWCAVSNGCDPEVIHRSDLEFIEE